MPPKSNLVVNIVFNLAGLYSLESSLPEMLPEPYDKSAFLFTIAFYNIPRVNPTTMESMGPVAYEVAREATKKWLDRPHTVKELSSMHRLFSITSFLDLLPSRLIPFIVRYVAIDGSSVDIEQIMKIQKQKKAQETEDVREYN